MPTEVSIMRSASIPDDVVEAVREHARKCPRCTTPRMIHGFHVETRVCPVAVLMVENAATLLRSARRHGE